MTSPLHTLVFSSVKWASWTREIYSSRLTNLGNTHKTRRIKLEDTLHVSIGLISLLVGKMKPSEIFHIILMVKIKDGPRISDSYINSLFIQHTPMFVKLYSQDHTLLIGSISGRLSLSWLGKGTECPWGFSRRFSEREYICSGLQRIRLSHSQLYNRRKSCLQKIISIFKSALGYLQKVFQENCY